MIETYLQDGFHELFAFNGHSRSSSINVKGFLGLSEHKHHHHHRHHNNQNVNKDDHVTQYVSWDSKCLMLWQYNTQTRRQPKVMQQIKYHNQPNLISAVVYIDKMKIFLAACLDMTFRLYDSELNLLETIHHEERAILNLQYDNDKGLIMAACADGISVWKIYRNNSLSYSHAIEKMFKFDNVNFWVSKMIYDRHFHRIYALSERSVYILSFRKRGVISKLEDIHDAPITAVCWYGRSQFYLTGCCQGFIKCWTSHYVAKKIKKGRNTNGNSSLVNHHDGDDTEIEEANESVAQTYVLLFTFTIHNKTISSITLHSVSGLAISTSLDGFFKVLNLEAFTVLFSFNVNEPILELKLMPIGTRNENGCLFTTKNGPIRFWKITSYCHFYGLSVSKIHSMIYSVNLQLEVLKEYHDIQVGNGIQEEEYANESIAASDDLRSDPLFALENKEGGLAEFSYDSLTSINSFSTTSSSSDIINDESSDILNDKDYDEDEDFERAATKKKASKKNKNVKKSTKSKEKLAEQQSEETKDVVVEKEEKQKMHEKYLVVNSFQDLRIFSENGGLISCLEPEQVVDNILSSCVSAYQDLLLAMYDNNEVKVFCLRSSYCKFLRMLPIEIVDREKLTCMTIINIRPSGSTSMNNIDRVGHRLNARGEPTPGFIEEFIVVGTTSGALYFFDTLSDFSMSISIAINNGSVKDLKFRRGRKELLAYCCDYSGHNFSIKVIKLPDLIISHEINNIMNSSCFEVSPTLSFFAAGCIDGNIRLFTLLDDIQATELLKQTSMHDGAVIAMSFCDDLRVFASSSEDASIKIWTYEKELLRSIKFSNPSVCASFTGTGGDVLLSQNAYILVMKRADWDEGGALKFAKEYRDPWMVDEWSNDNEDEKKTIQLNTAAEDKITREPLPGITFLTETFEVSKPYAAATVSFDFKQAKPAIIDTTNPIRTEFSELLQKGTPINTSRPRFRIERKQSLKVEIDGVPDKNDTHNNDDYRYKHISEKVASLNLSPRAGAVLINPTIPNYNIIHASYKAVAPLTTVSSALRNKVSSSYKMNRQLKYDDTILNNNHNINNKDEEMKATLVKMRTNISNRIATIQSQQESIMIPLGSNNNHKQSNNDDFENITHIDIYHYDIME